MAKPKPKEAATAQSPNRARHTTNRRRNTPMGKVLTKNIVGLLEKSKFSLDDSRTTKESGSTTVDTTHESRGQKEDQNFIAVPTPICQGYLKLQARDGSFHFHQFQPVPGLEHLVHELGHDILQGGPSNIYKDRLLEISPRVHVSHTHVPGMEASIKGLPEHHTFDEVELQDHRTKTDARKKAFTHFQSNAGGSKRPNTTQTTSEDEDTYEESEDGTEIISEVSHTFYVGDFAQLKKFFRRRLDELTMKPLRPIVTAWIKQLEPKRLGAYGPYHKKIPSEMPSERSPGWWPRDVPYEEPSHLGKTGLLELAVDLMLQHRAIDIPKRRSSWVAKMQQAAHYAVETTPPEHFSSAKRVAFSEQMRDRALNEILPTMFEAAKTYEDHLVQYSLYEGHGTVDPGNGAHISWQAASRPTRLVSQKKRAKRSRGEMVSRLQNRRISSGDETEEDDTACKTYSRKQRRLDCKQSASADETDVDDTMSVRFLSDNQSRAKALARRCGSSSMVQTWSPPAPLSSLGLVSSEPHTPSNPIAYSTSLATPSELMSVTSTATPNTSFNQSMSTCHIGEVETHAPAANTKIAKPSQPTFDVGNEHCQCNGVSVGGYSFGSNQSLDHFHNRPMYNSTPYVLEDVYGQRTGNQCSSMIGLHQDFNEYSVPPLVSSFEPVYSDMDDNDTFNYEKTFASQEVPPHGLPMTFPMN